MAASTLRYSPTQLDWHVTPADPEPAPGASQPPLWPELAVPSAAETAEDIPPDVPGDVGAGEGEPVRTRRRWPWVVLVVLIVVALLGWVAGVGIVLRGRSFGPPLPVDTAVRPTFVIATPPSPSPSGSPRPAAVPTVTAGDEYTVAAGDTLRSIAERVYGDPTQWPRIYDANRQTVGPDPDALNAGTRLRIPRP
jgi:hypothetical protein